MTTNRGPRVRDAAGECQDARCPSLSESTSPFAPRDPQQQLQHRPGLRANQPGQLEEPQGRPCTEVLAEAAKNSQLWSDARAQACVGRSAG